MITTMVIAVLSGLLFMSTCLAFMQWVRARRAEFRVRLLSRRLLRVHDLLEGIGYHGHSTRTALDKLVTDETPAA